MELPPRYRISEGQKPNPNFGKLDKDGKPTADTNAPAIPAGKPAAEPKPE